jgi:hypothetical protein
MATPAGQQHSGQRGFSKVREDDAPDSKIERRTDRVIGAAAWRFSMAAGQARFSVCFRGDGSIEMTNCVRFERSFRHATQNYPK